MQKTGPSKTYEISIQKIQAREVLDSRGFPTVEVDLSVNDPKHSGEIITARALVPSGASTGEGEALEMRDGNASRFLGKGVQKAVRHVQNEIATALVGQRFQSQFELDNALRQLDGTPNKSKLGANAILGVSMAFLRASALTHRVSTDQWIASLFQTQGTNLPVPLMNIINGGKHADNQLEVQEFMIVPAGFPTFSEALRAGCEIFHHLKQLLHKQNLSTGVGDEGGFAPVFQGQNAHEQAIQVILRAIEKAGYQAGKNIFLALDAAASEFYSADKGYRFEKNHLSSKDMVSLYTRWVEQYPIVSIEDGLAENDWSGWELLTQTLTKKCQLVGDDLFVTNPIFLKKGIDKKTANAILIKLNQIGTVTETLDTMRMAKEAQYRSIVSHRSGETEDTFIADLAVGTDCGQIKTGSASRTDRIAKYNQLLRLEEKWGEQAQFAGLSVFKQHLKT